MPVVEAADRPRPPAEPVFVEVVRLLIVLMATMAGLAVGKGGAHGGSPVLGASVGAGVGYVVGGIFGRMLERTMDALEARVERAPAAQVLVGAVGSFLAGGLGVVVGLPAVVLLPGAWGWPIFGLTTWLGLHAGFVVASRKSTDLLHLVGLQAHPIALLSAAGDRAVLIDSSAAIDGRLAGLVDGGLVDGPLCVTEFVLGELQGLADSSDLSRRRRGRRGLEVLDGLKGANRLTVLPDDVPEHDEVDMKLVALAQRLGARLVTTDGPLVKVARLQGVGVIDLTRLAAELVPAHVAGDVVRLPITKPGKDPGQGVGYLDDGTMVVVGNGAGHIGEDLDVRIQTSVRTAQGRLLFASLVGR